MKDLKSNIKSWLRFAVLALATILALSSVDAWSMSARSIRKEIRAERDNFRVCFEQALEKHPRLKGKTELSWSINDQGRAQDIRITRRTKRSVDVCLARTLAQIQFPKAKKGQLVSMSYPFVFDQAPLDKNHVRGQRISKIEVQK